jgi:hypothetical protein
MAQIVKAQRRQAGTDEQQGEVPLENVVAAQRLSRRVGEAE